MSLASVFFAALPVAKAPLERTGLERQPVQMEVAPFSHKTDFLTGVRFVSGNRSLIMSGNDRNLDCNNPLQFGRVFLMEGRDLKAALWIKANGLWNGKPDPSDRLTVDKDCNRAVWSRAYALPDGTKATFSYAITGRTDGTALIEVDTGVSQEVAEAQTKKIAVDAMLQLGEFATIGRSFGFGDQPHVFKDDAEMAAANRTQFNYGVAGGKESGTFYYEKNDSARFWSMAFPQDWMNGASCIDYRLKTRTDRPSRSCVYIFDLGTFLGGNARKHTVKSQIVVDFGKSSVPKIPPTPAVGGIDFWGQNALHVPVPPTRNLLLNGSFEQDFKGWTWEDWGATFTEPKDGKYKEEIESCGKFGRHALVLRGASQPMSAAIISAPMSLNADQPHVFSFWAKCESSARDVYLNARPCSVSRTAKFFDQTSPKAFKATKLNPDNAWHRYEIPFTPDGGGIYVRFSAPGNAVVSIDGVQVEEGSRATDFAEAPFVANLLTSAPLNDLKPGDPIDARLDIQAQPGAKGKVRVRITNFFDELKYDQTFPLKGDVLLPLNLDSSTLGRGLFIVRLDYETRPVAERAGPLVEPTSPGVPLAPRRDGSPTQTIPGGPLAPRRDKRVAWTDYTRFSILKPLANQHATSQFYAGHAWYDSLSRGDIGVRKSVEWGWGSVDGRRNSQMVEHPLVPYLDKYGIRNYVHIVAYERQVMMEVAKTMPESIAVPKSFHEWTEATPARLALVEATAYRLAKECRADDDIWSFWNEEESWARQVGFEVHWQFNAAVQRGVKKAFAERGLKPRFTESHGTSHYFNGRNYDAIEGYLKTANAHGFKYDVVDIHPYQNIDGGILGGKDSDLETAHLIQQMKEAGYPDATPILFTECFNMSPFLIPQWGADGWNDSYRKNTQPSQALGWREVVQAGSMARLYIIALKYWPKVQLAHTWTPRPFLDQRFTPIAFALAPNILGHLLGDPQYVGDAQPYGDVRGYCFMSRRGASGTPGNGCVDEMSRRGASGTPGVGDSTRGPVRSATGKKKAVMAVWTTNHDVEYGTKPSPILTMDLPPDTRFVDFEGNVRTPSASQLVKHSNIPNSKIRTFGVKVPLTPAPLFLVSKDAEGLLKALREAVADDPATAFSVDVRPDLAGDVKLVLRNETKAHQKGLVKIGEKEVAYDVGPREKGVYSVGRIAMEPMKAQHWSAPISLQSQPWNVDFFYVPKCGVKPDWSAIPAQPLKTVKGTLTSGYAAETKMAWNKDFFFIRVEVVDPSFKDYKENGRVFDPKALYAHDGCLEVYFDGFGDARGQGTKGYDLNDSRYDFLGEHVHRFLAVNWQLAQGTKSATDEEVQQKLIRTFTRTATGYVYEIAFAARYMAPIDLKAGTVAGVGVCLHDYDFSKNPKKPVHGNLSNSTSPGTDLDKKPYLLPIMILKD